MQSMVSYTIYLLPIPFLFLCFPFDVHATMESFIISHKQMPSSYSTAVPVVFAPQPYLVFVVCIKIGMGKFNARNATQEQALVSMSVVALVANV